MEVECDYTTMSDPDARDGVTKQHYADAKVIPALSDQDIVRIGGENGDWYGVVADGHGKGRVTEALRSIPDWAVVCRADRPIMELQRRVAALAPTFRDGSTVAIARIVDGAFQAAWLGDSRIVLFKDGARVWQSRDHGTQNPEEVERALRAGCKTQGGGHAIRVLTPTSLTMVASPVLELGRRDAQGGARSYVDATNITRCLGHDHGDGPRLPQDPGRWTCHLEPGCDYKVVIGSDGLWDMMCDDDLRILGWAHMTAARIADFARDRWRQMWTYRHPDANGGLSGTSTRERMPSEDRDDISVAVWSGRVVAGPRGRLRSTRDAGVAARAAAAAASARITLSARPEDQA